MAGSAIARPTLSPGTGAPRWGGKAARRDQRQGLPVEAGGALRVEARRRRGDRLAVHAAVVFEQMQDRVAAGWSSYTGSVVQIGHGLPFSRSM